MSSALKQGRLFVRTGLARLKREKGDYKYDIVTCSWRFKIRKSGYGSDKRVPSMMDLQCSLLA